MISNMDLYKTQTTLAVQNAYQLKSKNVLTSASKLRIYIQLKLKHMDHMSNPNIKKIAGIKHMIQIFIKTRTIKHIIALNQNTGNNHILPILIKT